MPTIPRANRRMNNMLRKERSDMEAYQYGGGTEAEENGNDMPPEGPDAAIIAIDAAPPDELAEEVTESFTVLEPGEEDPPDMYVYAPGETPGTWTMYPPGVPCDTGTVRVALDHPATAADLARMDEELGEGEVPIPTEAEVY